ncbi:hypothetical protein KIH41_00150 [Litoribacter ruber]|uniref:hypothetical protein n=1 Tax=Litoribacter ruber TaxID=702568 RepID=UPI001BDA883E|nr:hypothetical protein [Litoribacter ruber]MBT0809685.1 hypothetical protein [Litoribacter ruber]
MNRPYSSFALVLTLFLFCATSLSAQTISLDELQEEEIYIPSDKSFMILTFPLSTFSYQTGYENMQSRLNSIGGLEQPKLFEHVSFGVGWRRKNLFYNLNASFPIFSQRKEISAGSMTRSVEVRDGNLDFTIGYALLPSERFYWIIRSGLGYHFREMNLKEVSSTPFDLEDFRNPVGTSWPQLEHQSITWDIAFEMMPKAMRKVSVLQSAQLGYKYGLGSPQWKSQETTLVNPIRDRVSTFYLRALIVINKEN